MTEYGVNYGDVRDFIINKGVADLFAVGGQIVNPVERVIPLLNFLRSKKFFKSENDSPLADFISAFFSFNRIFGFDWKKVSWDKPAQAGFAQSFLEYIANVVIPLWNNTFELDCTLRNLDATIFLCELLFDKNYFKMLEGMMNFQDEDVRLRLMDKVSELMLNG